MTKIRKICRSTSSKMDKTQKRILFYWWDTLWSSHPRCKILCCQSSLACD